MTSHTSKSESRPRTSGDKRERILEAAVDIFAQKGYYAARVSDVASAAGIADGTIYLYFKSKEAILISLFEYWMERIASEVALAMDEQPDTSGKLRGFIRGHVMLAERYPTAAQVLTVELRQSSKLIREYRSPAFHAYMHSLVEMLARGQRDGVLRSNFEPRILARAIFGALDEMALSWTMSKKRQPMAEIAEQLFEVFYGGLAQTPVQSTASRLTPVIENIP